MQRTVPADGGPVHMIASLGGHLEVLVASVPHGMEDRVVWITSAGVRADELRSEGHPVHELPRLDRGSLGVRSILSGVRLALRERPSTVVTSGAGLAVPFCVVSRLLGARLVFVETMARVKGGSRTGRLLSKLSSDVVVQWPELLESSYPDAHLCAPLLLEGIGAEAAGERNGTFVTVGSHDAPFDRLLSMVSRATESGLLPRPVVVQHGVASPPKPPVDGVAWLEPSAFRDAVRSAEIVVTHGGAGAIGTALRAGTVPIVVSRSARLGEHVDDHQEDLVDKLADLGLIVKVDRGDFTAADLDAARREPDANDVSERPSVRSTLGELLATQN